MVKKQKVLRVERIGREERKKNGNGRKRIKEEHGRKSIREKRIKLGRKNIY